MIPMWLILVRAAHIGACLLLFGTFAFDRLVVAAVRKATGGKVNDCWSRKKASFTRVSLAVILVSGIFWLALVAMTMSGEPLGSGIVKTVWSQTQFGAVCKVRLGLWLAAAVIAVSGRPGGVGGSLRHFLAWLELPVGGALLGALAWAGHGQEHSAWHLSADILHLLVAGLWPAGLLPFLLLLQNLRRRPEPETVNIIAALVRRFSAVSLASVALLTLTGLANSWFLVGSLANLFQQPYGRWLLLKLALFFVAVVIGAVNLLRLKPRIVAKDYAAQKQETAGRQLEYNVRLELFLGVLIIVVVAVLGILPPAGH